MTTRSPAPLLLAIACAAPAFALTFTFTTRASAQQPDEAPAAPSTPTTTPAAEPAPSNAPAAEPATTDEPASGPPAEEAKDNDLGLEWVWLNAEVGYSYMDLKSADLAISPAGGTPITIVDTSSAGAAYGFGAGVRLLFLTLGLRARNHTAMNLWQIDGEVGFHGRIGRVDPYLAARFGYDTVGTLGQSVQVAGSSTAPPDVSVHGWNGGLAIGFDYYFAHAFSLGIEGAGDVVYLKRPAASPPALTADQQRAIDADPQAKANYQKLLDAYQASASAVGFGAGVFVHAGLHF